jgi:hypothetical protein
MIALLKNRKLTYAFLVCLLSVEAFAQSNVYPTTGTPIIYDYSPGLTLQRNTATGGFTQGIQTKLQNGDNNWFFGNLDNAQWMVAKGDYQYPKFVVLSNGNVGVGTAAPGYKLHVNGDIAIPYTARLLSDLDGGNNIAIHDGNGLMKFATAGIDRLIIANGGNVGIGTISPTGILELQKLNSNLVFDLGTNGLSKIISKGWNASIDMHTFQISGTENLNQFNINANGNVGIGTATPAYNLDVNKFLRIGAQGGSDVALLGGGSGVGAQMKLFYHNGMENVRLTGNNDSWLNATIGNVGIGTTTPTDKLSVNGKIRAKEIKVETANWPDYVFEEGYQVGTLEELERYIKKNKHLPEMPSAKEVEANGVELGELNKLLLKKVEELTLYLIKNNETVSSQRTQLKIQEERINKLEELIKSSKNK